MRLLAENQDVAVLHKMPTGVEGFDAITGGGLPRNRTSLIFGGPGGGKTVFALQTLVNGARQFGEPGIFVAFEENSRHILANAGSFGWNLPKLEKKQLSFFRRRLRVHAVYGGLRGRPQTAGGRSDRLAIRPGNQIPRLQFRRERGAARYRSLGNGSGRYQRHDSRPRDFTRAGVQRRRTAGRDAWRWLLPRLQRADHRFRRHG